jgi:hypothetical protein
MGLIDRECPCPRIPRSIRLIRLIVLIKTVTSCYCLFVKSDLVLLKVSRHCPKVSFEFPYVMLNS